VNYGYDSLYRLTSESVAGDPNGKNGTVSYALDSVGNRQQMVSTLPPVPAGMFFYDANDRLTTDTYDADGNTVSSGGIADSYDFENHLTKYGNASIVYDGDGNRVSETVGGGTTKYVVDNNNPSGYPQVLEELTNGALKRKYTWGHWLLSENQLANATWTKSFYLYDGHGSVRNLTNASGNITDAYTYDAFGNLINSTGSTPNNYLFAGEQFDPVLGLYYNRARYLDTNTGRFWSMDSYEGNNQGPLSLHKYTYAAENPVNHLDASGNDFDLGSTIGALSIGATVLSLSTILNTPVTNSVRVEAHFDKLGSFPIYGDYYHAFLLVFKPGSPPSVVRAGPSVPSDPDEVSDTSKDLAGAGYNEMLGFGYLTTGGCINVPWTPATGCDFPHPGNVNEDVAKMSIPVTSFNTDVLLLRLTAAAHYVDTLLLPYHPVSQNSNSFIHTLIKKAGLGDPTPNVNVPGWDHILY
jgi:RHS repeat-associated protein